MFHLKIPFKLQSDTSNEMKEKIPLVFIHGIKGSTLVGPSGTTQWVNAAQVLGLRTPNLALPLHWKDETQLKDNLSSNKILEKISFLPHLIQKQIYGKWLALARKNNRTFYPFAYDWRRDNLETLENFKAFVGTNPQKRKAQRSRSWRIAWEA